MVLLFFYNHGVIVFVLLQVSVSQSGVLLSMPPRCLPPSELGGVYKHHGGFRMQLSRSLRIGGATNRAVRGPVRTRYSKARADLARARTCASREAMVAFVSGGCRQENLPSNPEILRAEQRACFSSRRLCGKRALALMETCVVVVCLLLIVHSPLLFCSFLITIFELFPAAVCIYTITSFSVF
jgi:hypothetical protein